jgi:hypothetical protein
MVLKQVKALYPEQAYFYSTEWQAGEANADKDIAKGMFGVLLIISQTILMP